ncbi:MAG: hypothetical protein NC340_03075 [Ruminococcus flavefaciens]|nr:hypothetical protein [Ruminococcus flavefaciens]MCM1229483.1 hypothetical protein [Ruminococcus flavefaciens]
MQCVICGTENDSKLKFCMKCGCNLTVRLDDEPFIPRLDADRVSLPQPGSTPMPSPNAQGPPPVNMPPPNNPYMNAPPPMYGGQYGQPQIIGYDPSGMPIYAPPPVYNQYAQPQIIGYDPSGMPIYAPPPVYNQYGQPQIIGYDQSGMPIYAPPPAYNQYGPPQGMGYPPPQPPPQQPQGMAGMPDMPVMSTPEPQEDEKVDVPDDFWAFFDGGKSSKHREEQSADDFFGKSSHGGAMGDVSVSGLDLDSLRRADKKKNSYMNDTPVVDASKLEKNDVSKYNEMYMKKAEAVNSNDLAGNGTRRKNDGKMVSAKQVEAVRMPVKLKVRPRVSMGSAGQANPDSLEAYIPQHKESIMAQADHAVEAMPKHSNPYENELDAIELPEYMQARKTKREETFEIPSLPELNKK